MIMFGVDIKAAATGRCTRPAVSQSAGQEEQCHLFRLRVCSRIPP
jgi:hypothetical protein